jgi:hypothetical protein
MKEKTDTPKLGPEYLFKLEVQIPEQIPRWVEVEDQLLAGIDPRNDLILVDPKVRAKHFLFTKKENLLTVQYLGKNWDTFLNGLPLEKDKVYILEKDDFLKIGKIQIKIHRLASNKPSSAKTSSVRPLATSNFIYTDDFVNLNESEKDIEELPIFLNIEAPQIVKRKTASKDNGFVLSFSAVKLVPYKFYGFIVDTALTYLILSFVFPNNGLLTIVQDFLYPISDYISQLLTHHQNTVSPMKTLSIIEFFICFHLFMLVGSLLLGTTPGAFLIGLHTNKENHNNFLTLRFKAYIYALLNVFVLPLIVFDIPIYKGKNLKEILTFSKREVRDSLIFKTLRRAIIPVGILACFFSPFFLTSPYTANITFEKNAFLKYKDVHSNTLSSSAYDLGFSLNSELGNQYKLLPSFEKSQIGFVLYDLKNNTSLLMKEVNRIPASLALFKLRYANPIASLTTPDNLIESENLKRITSENFSLSLSNFISKVFKEGPFIANGFLFKEQFIKNFNIQDNFLFNAFDKKNPVLKISTLDNEVKVFLFARKEIIQFNLLAPKESNLLEVFTNSVLSGLHFDQSNNNGLKNPQILEVIEAFERSNHPLLLTYYINEAKKVQDSNNPLWRLFLLKNVEQTKRALVDDITKVGMNKNVEKSFDDIINMLLEHGKK